MTVRDQNLQNIGFLTATFKIHQTATVDDLKDADIGKAVSLSGNYEVSLGTNGGILLGKLVDLSLTDADNGKRVATVQIGGICTLTSAATTPVIGNRVVVNGDRRGQAGAGAGGLRPRRRQRGQGHGRQRQRQHGCDADIELTPE